MPRKRKTPEERLVDLWEDLSGYPLWLKGFKTMCGYVELIGAEEVEEAVIASAERPGPIIDRWRYFCGICRNKVAEQMDPTSQPGLNQPRTQEE